MGLQYKNEHGDCPITLTVPNDGSVKGWLVTKCVAANHDASAFQVVTVTHDTVKLAQIGLAQNNNTVYTETNGSKPASGWGDGYTEYDIGSAKVDSLSPVTRDIRQAAGVWLAPGDTFQVAGTNCRASVTYMEEI